MFEQAGYVHELDPKSGKSKIVNITAAGDFPWMMPNWEDVSNCLTNMVASPTGKRVVVEARGEIFTIPADKGDVRNLTNSSASAERDPAWSPDGKIRFLLRDNPASTTGIESQDGLTPPREITIEKPTRYYTPSWSPDSKKIPFTDTNLKVWVLDIATEKAKRSWARIRGWCRSARSIRRGVRFEVGRVKGCLRSLYHAIHEQCRNRRVEAD